MKQPRILSKSLYLWIRDLHLYLGLFISPFILVFAISTIFFNHAWNPSGSNPKSADNVQKMSASIKTPPIAEDKGVDIEQAKQILRQLGVSGEIDYISHRKQENRLVIPVVKPGQRITINVDLNSQMAQVERRHTGLWDAMMYLHKSPGMHNVKIRGNWFFTRFWRLLADITVYLTLFISASGIYMWTVIKAERKIGLIMLGLGCVSFVLIVLALVG
jgi:hypothetical protein